MAYLVRHNKFVVALEALRSRYTAPGKTSVYFVWILAVLLLISTGIAYRVLVSFTVNTVINLPVPLSSFPSELGNWTGIELDIPTTTREYMEKNFADDYVSRRYINNRTQAWANLYVVYCASRPGGMLGHQPQVCYPGNGWIHDSTDKSQFISRQGKEIPCLLHRFHKPAPQYSEIVVLNFYLVNGELATNQKGFIGILGRRLNLNKNPARYVAQVQISSALENPVRAAAKDMTELILDLLPDKNGKVKALQQVRLLGCVF